MFFNIVNEPTRGQTGTHSATFTFDIGSFGFGVPNTIENGHVDAIRALNDCIGLIDTADLWCGGVLSFLIELCDSPKPPNLAIRWADRG